MSRDPDDEPAEAGSAKESVWDYPRPPRLEPAPRHLRVELAGTVLADTRRAYRVLETSSPPAYYFPPEDVAMQHLIESSRRTYCEWKGDAGYCHVVVGAARRENAAWFYANPSPGFEAIRDYVAFYPSRMDACTVDGERVEPQPGSYYGGWITSDLVGPFKGEPGSEGW